MRKLVWITIAVAALAGAGLAVAHGLDSKSIKSVSATFTATGSSVVKTSTCTGSDGTYATTKATYTGMSTSTDPTLNGPITLDTQSLVNTTTGFGIVSGKLEIDTGGKNTDAQFDAVLSNGNVAGLAEGHAQDPHSDLIANLSAAFSTSGGFASGKLGGATSGGDAVESSPGGCKPAPAPKPDTIQVHGAVSALTTTSITAAGVTCVIPPDLAASVTGLGLTTTPPASQVQMTCTVSGGTTTLTKITAGGHSDKNDGHSKH